MSVNTDENYTDEEIAENAEERARLALELLRKHPHVVDTWSCIPAWEFGALFKTVNPDTDEIEIILGLDRWDSVMRIDEDHGLVFDVTWDINQEYTYVSKDGEEVPFTEWSKDFNWSLLDYETTIQELLNEAGYYKVQE